MTIYLKSLKTSEIISKETGDAGTDEFKDDLRRAKMKRDSLNQTDSARPWVCYYTGQTAPSTCPHCGSSGPFT